MRVPFHLSVFVKDLESTRAFYTGVIGCKEGHTFPQAVDFSFYGHQLTCHAAPERVRPAAAIGLDGNHFGVVLDLEEFERLEARLRAAKAEFLTQPETQHVGTPRERRKMIFTDPSGNAIEVKYYRDPSAMFG